MGEEVKKVYDIIAEEYISHSERSFYNIHIADPAFLELIDELDLEDKKVLELGCGSGKHISYLVNKKAEVYGADICKELLNSAREKNPDIEFKVADIDKKLPYNSSFFDVVVSNLVVHYSSNILNLLMEINRILKKGGFFVFSTINPFSDIISLDNESRIKVDNYFKEGKRYSIWPSFGIRMPYYHFTLQTIINSIVNSGFLIEKYVDAKPTKKNKISKKEELSYRVPRYCFFKIKKKDS